VKCAGDGIKPVGFTRVNRSRHPGGIKRSERVGHSGNRKTLFRASDIKSNDAAVAVANGEFCNLERPVRLSHRTQQLANSYRPARLLCTRNSAFNSTLYGIDGFIKTQATFAVQLRCPANLGVDNAIGDKIINELPGDAFEVVGGLHDRQRHGERREVIRE
jgi:hypothetical protein